MVVVLTTSTGNLFKNHKFALIAACCFIVLLLSSTVYFFASAPCPQSAMITRPALPLDVDAIVHNYKITNEKGDNVLRFEGKRLVRRGQKYWGVRSTIAKNNFFEDVRGTFVFNNGFVKFSAKEASWWFSDDSPILLKGNVEVTINNKQYHNATAALIKLITGIVELNGDSFSIAGATNL